MIVRIWTTGVLPDRIDDYLTFAESRSLPMFLRHDGCLGVLFLRRSERDHAVVSFWRDAAAVEAFNASPDYRATVEEILAEGFLTGEQSVTAYESEGGSLDVHFRR